MAGGKVVTNCNCCGGGGTGECNCSLPTASCPHAVCFAVNIDALEVSENAYSEDFISAEAPDGSLLFAVDVDYVDFGGGALWYAHTRDDTQSTVPIKDNNPSILSDTWHCIEIAIVAITGGFSIRLTVDGVASSSWADVTSLKNIGRFIAGNDQSHGLSVHRSIRNVSVLGKPGTAEQDFHFAPDSFDSLVGGASIVGGDTLRCDAGLGTSYNYGRKDISPQHQLDCGVCFAQNLTYFNTIAAAIHVDATASGACNINFSQNFNVSFTRVDRIFASPSNPAGGNFQLYNDCTYGLDTNHDIFNTAAGNTTLSIPTQSASVPPCTGGDNANMQLTGGSIAFNIAGNQMVCVLTLAASCFLGAALICNLSDSFGGNTPIPSTFQALPGTYTVSGTTTPAGWTLNYSIIVTVS